MHPTITFKVNLSNGVNDSILHTLSTWIPSGLTGGSNIDKKHGDTFQLSGQKALYLKKLIEDQEILDITIDEEIVVEEPVTFSLFTVSSDNAIVQQNSLYTINEEGDFEFIKAFAEEYVYIDNVRMAFNDDDGLIYLIAERCRGWDGECDTYFEKINPETQVRTQITLSETLFDPYGLAWNTSANKFKYISDEGLLQEITTDGVVTTLASDIWDIYQLTYHNGFLYGADSNNVFKVNETTGEKTDSVSLFNEGYDFQGIEAGLASLDGSLYVIVRVDNPDEEDEESSSLYYISTVNTETGEFTPVQLIGYGFMNFVSDGTKFIGVTYANGEGDSDFDSSSLYPIDISDEVIVGEKILTLGQTTTAEIHENIAFNTDDGFLYHLATDIEIIEGEEEVEVETVKFNKLDLDSLTLTDIETSGLPTGTFVYNGFISDGGDDMYDGGNFLNTNISNSYEEVNNGQIYNSVNFLASTIPYTHTKNTDSPPTSFPKDGVVTDGTDYFGEGSTFFTNFYEGLFVLVAKNISITEFFIVGNNGADNGGTVDTVEIPISVNETSEYTAYVKRVHGAGDPSINHIIIVPGDGTGITHTIGGSTDLDDDLISGITGNTLFYLLVSSASGGFIDDENIAAIATEFLSIVDGYASASTVLNLLNKHYLNITNLIPNMYTFSDEGVDTQGYPGIGQVVAFTYVAEGTFILASNVGLFSLTTDGILTSLNSDLDDIRGLAWLNETLYAVTYGDEGENFLLKTIEVGGEWDFIESDELVYEDNINDFKALTARDGTLYAIVEYNGEEEGGNTAKLATIDLESKELTFFAEVDRGFTDLANIPDA